jgi:hypothetical protein
MGRLTWRVLGRVSGNLIQNLSQLNIRTGAEGAPPQEPWLDAYCGYAIDGNQVARRCCSSARVKAGRQKTGQKKPFKGRPFRNVTR